MNRRSASVVAAAFAALALLVPAGAAASATSSIGPHDGKIGRHVLVDSASYPGAECKYDPGSGDFKSIRVRPPIGYAYDSSSKTDLGEVGYRIVLQIASSPTTAFSDWNDLDQSGYTQDHTTDKQNDNWPSWKSLKLATTPRASAYYRAAVEFRWSTGGYARTIGIADHAVSFYSVVPMGGVYRLACPGNRLRGAIVGSLGSGADALDAGAVSPAASGRQGVHILLDNAEYPGEVCRYQSVSNRERLTAFTVTAPIVYAIDSTNGVDSGRVGWRVRLQATNKLRPGTGDWFNVLHTTYKAASATDAYNSQWGARSVSVPTTVSHPLWRIVVDMRWYDVSGAVGGSASIVVRNHVVRVGSTLKDPNAPGPCTLIPG